jgi:PKD repeat protein
VKYHEIVPINPANIPVADFTGTPTSGTAPLTVAFNDTSTHTPIAWSWNFSYGGTSEEQNPVHTFENPGTYTVRMTAANAGGADTEVKEGYVTVTAPQTTFYVYADGVSLYHNFEGNGDLYYSNITPGSFYDKIVGKCGDPYYHTCWYGIGKPIDEIGRAHV